MKKIKTYDPFFAVLLIMLAFVVFVIPVTNTAFADSEADKPNIRYTDVVTDFNADPNFDYAKYPVNGEDHGIYLIQVAEGVNKELFAYIYCPSKLSSDIGCWMRFNTLQNSAEGIKDYKLNYLSSSGTLSKWLVEDFTVSSDNIRYYNIVQLMRSWYTYIDGDPTDENGNIQKTKAYEVRSCITASTQKDKVVYESTALETITITYKDIGVLTYEKTSGPAMYREYCFYAGIATDRRMDKLVEADVTFKSVYYLLDTPEDKKYEDHEKKLRADEYVDSQYGATFWTKKHTWSRIQSVDDFKSTEALTETAIEALEKAQWVLRFHQEFVYWNEIIHKIPLSYYGVDGFTVLRLKFITEGVVYDLGIVDNEKELDPESPPDGGNHENVNPGDEDTSFNKKPWFPDWPGSGSGDSGSDGSGGGFWDKVGAFFTDLWNGIKDFFTGKSPTWGYWLVIGIAAILLFVILFAVIPGLFPAFLSLLKYIGKGIIWLITLPVRGIKKLVNYIKEKRAEKS